MSLLAGFDVVVEISNGTLRKLLLTGLKFGDVAANPPFEIRVPIEMAGTDGTVHLVVTDIQLNLNVGDTVTLTLSFDHGSVVTGGPASLTVCPLDGSIAITAALELVDVAETQQQVALKLGAATVEIDWSATAENAIAKDLAGKPFVAATFNAATTQALTDFVHGVAVPDLPLRFSVIPGKTGTLSPSLQFERLEVHCIPNASQSKQALGIFGILLPENHSNGTHTKKTATAITAANDGVCISIGPDAFHSLVFCRSIAKQLGVKVAKLPTSCGSSDGLEVDGVTITRIADSFANGHIDIDGSVSKSGFCYEAEGTFHASITLAIEGGTLVPYVKMDEPDVDVDIPWYCYLGAAIVLGPLGIVLAGVVDGVGGAIASSLYGDSIEGAFGSGIGGAAVGGLPGVSYTDVAVTTEGVTLQGMMFMYVPISSAHPGLTLGGSVVVTEKSVIDTGTFHSGTPCEKAKDYPYTEYAQQQFGIYDLRGTLVAEPLTPRFVIKGGGGAFVPLLGTGGTIELPNVTTHYPTPIDQGGTAFKQTVHIGYSISRTSVQLTNTPSEGAYSVRLQATANDCNGKPVQDNSHADLLAEVEVEFEGQHVEIGGGYWKDVQECMEILGKIIHEKAKRYPRRWPFPIWPPVNYPPEQVVLEYIRNLLASGLPQAEEILVTSKVAHGNSFYRALFSPAAHQPHLLRQRDLVASQQQELRSLARELADLGERVVAGLQRR